MKSYLIVPEAADYIMNDTEKLRFTYEYEIPGNLPHNEDIYGTFLAYYTNNSDLIITDETSAPDIIGLTTGEGPELEVQITSDVETVSELENVKVVSKVKNIGKFLLLLTFTLSPLLTKTIPKTIVSLVDLI